MNRFILRTFLFISFVTLLSPPVVQSNPKKPNVVEYEQLIAKSRDPEVVQDNTGFKLVSDPHSTMDAVVIHCPLSDDPFLYDLIRSLNPRIHVYIVVTSKEAGYELYSNLKKRGLDKLVSRVQFIIGQPPLSKWGRDAYTVLHNGTKNVYTLLPPVLDENRREGWEDNPVRDLVLHSDLATRNIVDNSFSIPPTWGVDGGAITADKKYAYVGEGTVLVCQRNGKGEIKASKDDVLTLLNFITKKEMVVLPAGDLHSDRYHMPVGKTAFGERTSLLADPVKLLEIIASMTPVEKRKAMEKIREYGMGFTDPEFLSSERGKKEMDKLKKRLSDEELQSFFSVNQDDIKEIKKSLYVQWLNKAEKILQKKGINVVRIPTLDNSIEVDQFVSNSTDTATAPVYYNAPVGFYYVNIIQDFRKDGRYVIIPKYGIEKLDHYVKSIFESLHCYKKIHQVRNVMEGVEGGGPRCRLQTLGRFRTQNPFLKNVINDQ